jgi:hypothetical protein
VNIFNNGEKKRLNIKQIKGEVNKRNSIMEKQIAPQVIFSNLNSPNYENTKKRQFIKKENKSEIKENNIIRKIKTQVNNTPQNITQIPNDIKTISKTSKHVKNSISLSNNYFTDTPKSHANSTKAKQKFIEVVKSQNDIVTTKTSRKDNNFFLIKNTQSSIDRSDNSTLQLDLPTKPNNTIDSKTDICYILSNMSKNQQSKFQYENINHVPHLEEETRIKNCPIKIFEDQSKINEPSIQLNHFYSNNFEQPKKEEFIKNKYKILLNDYFP